MVQSGKEVISLMPEIQTICCFSIYLPLYYLPQYLIPHYLSTIRT